MEFKDSSVYGLMENQKVKRNYCLTPGQTFITVPGVRSRQHLPHTALRVQVPSCDKINNNNNNNDDTNKKNKKKKKHKKKKKTQDEHNETNSATPTTTSTNSNDGTATTTTTTTTTSEEEEQEYGCRRLFPLEWPQGVADLRGLMLRQSQFDF